MIFLFLSLARNKTLPLFFSPPLVDGTKVKIARRGRGLCNTAEKRVETGWTTGVAPPSVGGDEKSFVDSSKI